MRFTKVSFWLPILLLVLIIRYRFWLPSLLYATIPATAAQAWLAEIEQWAVLLHGQQIAFYGMVLFIFWQMARTPQWVAYQLESKKHYAAAVAAYTKAIRLMPEDDYSYMHRGWCHCQLGNYPAAIADYQQALRFVKQATQIPGLHYSCAQVYFTLGNHEQAIAECTKAITLFPLFVSGYGLRAFLAAARGQTDAAIADYQIAINLAVGRQKVEPCQRLCRLYREQGDHEAALLASTAVYAQVDDPKGRASILYDRVRSRFVLHDLQGVIDDCTEIITLVPTYYQALYSRGSALTRIGHAHEAINDFTNALDLLEQQHVTDQEVHLYLFVRRGDAYWNQGQAAAALADYDRAIALAPHNAELYAQKGLALNQLGRWEAAYQACATAVRLDPTAAFCWLEFAHAARRLGKIADWQEATKQARAAAHNLAPYNLACLESVAGNPEQALSYLQASTQAANWNPDWARRDPDLEWIRDDPRFEAILVGSGPGAPAP